MATNIVDVDIIKANAVIVATAVWVVAVNAGAIGATDSD